MNTNDIKFRGLRDNGEWVYGGFAHRLNNHPCIVVLSPIERPNEPGCYDAHWDVFVDVYEDTIGQFTGLYDHLGHELYDGDVLGYAYNKRGITRIVHWRADCGCWFAQGAYDDFPLAQLLNDNTTWELCGNIFDNPEFQHNDAD